MKPCKRLGIIAFLGTGKLLLRDWQNFGEMCGLESSKKYRPLLTTSGVPSEPPRSRGDGGWGPLCKLEETAGHPKVHKVRETPLSSRPKSWSKAQAGAAPTGISEAIWSTDAETKEKATHGQGCGAEQCFKAFSNNQGSRRFRKCSLCTASTCRSRLGKCWTVSNVSLGSSAASKIY